MIKNNKGITLVALVITIIVLLILAGVSISMLTGDNGILTKASDSADKTAIASIAESTEMATAAVKADELDATKNPAVEMSLTTIVAELGKMGVTATVKTDTTSTKEITYTYNGKPYTVKMNPTSFAILKKSDNTYDITLD